LGKDSDDGEAEDPS
jgi:hypothetical protein